MRKGDINTIMLFIILLIIIVLILMATLNFVGILSGENATVAP